MGVLIGTNVLFPPPAPEDVPVEEEVEAPVEEREPTPEEVAPEAAPEVPQVPPGIVEAPPEEEEVPAVEPEEVAAEKIVEVEGPLYRMRFSNQGAALVGAELLQFQTFVEPNGPVRLVHEGDRTLLSHRILVGADTIDLRGAPFEVEPSDGLRLEAGGDSGTLTFRYRHPDVAFGLEVEYLFDPDSYLVEARGRVLGIDRGLLITGLGSGLQFNEVDPDEEASAMQYVVNHRQEGIRSRALEDIEARRVEDGPFFWAAMKSRYFLLALLPHAEVGGADHVGGLLVDEMEGEYRAEVAATFPVGRDGIFAYRVFAGPQDFGQLQALGHDLEQVSPVGWGFFRPILRPFVGLVTRILVFFHQSLDIGYGWVLVLFGVLMRVILFPLNHKAMKAQLRNMAVQPLLKDIQTKYKDQPEKMQKELMRLYKEHGFNPIGGCWPMLIPLPILIALFFVLRETIELRGVPFLWLPDLSLRDPYFILPVLLGLSMFLLQWMNIRVMDEVPPQMKMMMWILPFFMVVIFSALPSGLNLYYFTANMATLPQSYWIAQERRKAQAEQKALAPTPGD